KHARRAVEACAWQAGRSQEETLGARVGEVHRWWIRDQIAYFDQKLGEGGAGRRRLAIVPKTLLGKHRLVRGLSIGAFALGLMVTLVLGALYWQGMGEARSPIAAGWAWAPGVLVAVSALVRQWGEVQGYAEDLVRFRLARSLFGRGDQELAACPDTDNRRPLAILQELADIAL
ncbi:MAG: hypothetical protein ABEK42_12225, partial [Thiohalorhabdaceae bacterium]